MARRNKESYSLGLQVVPTGVYNLDAQSLGEAQVDAWLAVLLGIGFHGTLTITGNASPSVPAGMLTAAALQTDRGSGAATITSDCAILKQDALFTVNGDGSWKISVATNGAGTTYQWQYQDTDGNWNDDGANTSATYNNPALALHNDDTGLDINALPSGRWGYRCKITRNAVVVYSSIVTVDIPVVSIASSNTFGSDDPNLTTDFGPIPTSLLLVDCYGPEGTLWAWYKDGVAITDANGTISYLTASVTASYTVLATGTYKLLATHPNGVKVFSDNDVWS